MAPIFWKFDNIVFDYSPYTAVAICILLALAYVGSLYVWTSTRKSRDHPETIKLRFVRVTIVCALVIPFLWLCGTKSHSVKARILFTWLGLRFKGFITATVLPLILTMVLFMGPLTLHYLDGIFRIYRDPQYWLSNLKNIIWLRNHVVAPISEEFIFRACMLPILVPSFGETWSIIVCPLAFGIAHLHHLHEKIRDGVDLKMALMNSLIQFSYTSVFGAYSAYIFLRTDHLVAPVIVHAFCNHMGLPNFQEVFAHSAPKRYYLMISFVVGLLLWSQLLIPFTNPALYSNDLYFSM
ncbi:hypothetical protein CAPTEDRAFT_19281 [Capitella teleta]|uniref:CAAX prenyl protease 2 n=1 Tax=Capitella teleta TaxID=283909 RepID=R7T615_CAPTE|nr:hypothetical protein CAPTEDRAFT_19281 [Capitella teleta]|eukprot:ELT88683.1 hypothetical protein CAPTEDRAFT_19281 [Capitella teleta]